jgi:hypothetical protein
MNKLDLSNKGAGVVGGIVGAVVGLPGGPAASIGGAAVGSLVADALKDFAGRMLSGRERVRLDSATSYIADGIEQELAAGRVVRQDDFFEGDANFSSSGAELLEGVLLKCKAQYQEKKVRLIANIFKVVAFDAAISAQMAYQVLNYAESLTYQQLCIIAFYGRKEEFEDFQILNEIVHFYSSFLGQDSWACVRDLFGFVEQGVLEAKDGAGVPGEYAAINPGKLQLAIRGHTFFKLLGLNEVLPFDILQSMHPIGYKKSWGISTRDTVNGVKSVTS